MLRTQTQIASHLLRIGAVKINAKSPFTWSSGMKSPIYCDNRLLLSYPQIRNEVKAAFVDVSGKWHSHDVIGGVATAGIPHGALLADAVEKPFIYVRSAPKSHGRQNRIEGHMDSGSRVLLIEDLISTGGSSLRAAEAIRAAGSEVIGILAIFSYGFEVADQASKEAGIPFRTLITLDDLLEAAGEMGTLSSDDIGLINNWRTDPNNWQAS